LKVISIRQPWAWLLMHSTKDLENRDWYSAHRGILAIHAAKGMTMGEYCDAYDFVFSFDKFLASAIPRPKDLVRGAIIGTMVMRGCVTESDSPWFTGRYGFVLDTPQPCEPIPIKGALGLWEWKPFAFARSLMLHFQPYLDTPRNLGDRSSTSVEGP
jgi:hypothetical protein